MIYVYAKFLKSESSLSHSIIILVQMINILVFSFFILNNIYGVLEPS
jgi:hypothetical protein